VVGDCPPNDATRALLQAAREATVNAVVHGRPPVSVYLEVSDTAAEVFIRDRGDGFDLDAIPHDRFGVRESILGRVQRRGGRASVRSGPGGGTEVRLRVPLVEQHGHSVPDSGATPTDVHPHGAGDPVDTAPGPSTLSTPSTPSTSSTLSTHRTSSSPSTPSPTQESPR
jgi:hypothetical protein